MIRNLHLRPWLLLFSVVSLAACTVYTTTPRATVVTESEVVEYDPPPPPPPPREVIPPPPSTVHVWIGGYYRWGGRAYVWAPGHYERRPSPRANYVPGHWQGRARGKVWVEGGWR